MRQWTSAAVVAALLTLSVKAGAADIAAEFQSPPASAKPHTWWHWMDGNITKEGITADLEAISRVGIGGVEAFDVGQNIPEGPVKYASQQWRDLMAFAVKEANRLHLEVGMHNCSGWSSTGGPWVTPDMGMQTLVISDTLKVKAGGGGEKVTAALPEPPLARNPSNPQLNLSQYAPFYHDVMVLAIKTPANDYRLPGWQMKSLSTDQIRNLSWEAQAPAEAVVKHEDVVNVTGMVKDGALNWDAPAGEWTILRIGYAPNGRPNKPATSAGKGLEIDKMNPAAVDFHFAKFLDLVLKDSGSLVGKDRTLSTLIIDSYETGVQNWTGGFEQEFKKRRGYDIVPFMPAFTGRIVDSAEVTERFLFDVRTTVAELFRDNYYKHFKEEVTKRGMLTGIEPYDGPFDSVDVGMFPDLPMSEFWNRTPPNQSRSRYVASAAHLSSHEIVGAEAFTSQWNEDKYTTDPYSLKYIGDFMFTEGINRMIFHRYALQPWVDPHGPGMTMGPWGFHMDRTNTWFEQSRGWVKYLARSQYLLQSGHNVADVLCFSSEQQLLHSRWGNSETPPIPPGYDWDFASTAVLQSAKVENGQIVMPNGLRFRALLLPDLRGLTPAALFAMDKLVADGATLIGAPPQVRLSLEGGVEAEAKFKKSVGNIWGDLDVNGKAVTQHAYGKGQAVWGKPVSEVLASLKVEADCGFSGGDISGLHYKHRSLPEGEVYFIASASKDAREVMCSFRIAGKEPELFHADTGVIEPAPVYNEREGRTEVPLQLDPSGSMFVVFRKPAKEHAVSLVSSARQPQGEMVSAFHVKDGRYFVSTSVPGNYIASIAPGKNLNATVGPLPAPVTVAGPWKVDFQAGRGAPASATFEKLISWPDNPDKEIKYFSGTATYTKNIDVPVELLANGQDVVLDLGDVKNIAEVKINGQGLGEAGLLWKPPFKVNVTRAVHPGSNALEIQVTNLWANRIIGDQQLPDDVEWVNTTNNRGKYLKEWPEWLLKGQPRPSGRLAFVTWWFYDKDAPLLPSGLIGPVTLQPVANVELK